MYRPSSGDGGFGTKVGGARTSFKPKRYATTCEPPTFVLEYGDDDLGLLRTRKVRKGWGENGMGAGVVLRRPHGSTNDPSSILSLTPLPQFRLKKIKSDDSLERTVDEVRPMQPRLVSSRRSDLTPTIESTHARPPHSLPPPTDRRSCGSFPPGSTKSSCPRLR